MQTIKIPFSIKFYFFFVLMGIFLSLLGIDYWYWYYWLNYLLKGGIISLLLSIIQVVLIFKYFNNPKKYSNINIYFIIFILLLYIWLTIYKSFFLIIIILYHLIFLYKFIKFKKILNLDQNNEEIENETKKEIPNIKDSKIFTYIKYIFFTIYQLIVFFFVFIIIISLFSEATNYYIAFIKAIILIIIFIAQFIYIFKSIKRKNNYKITKIEYTNENQYKNVLILYLIIIISFTIFYFVQYSKVIDFKYIDDNYFNIPEQYKNISDKENWFGDLKRYWEHINSLDFIEDKNFRNEEYMSKVISDTWISFKFDIDRVKEIDKLRLWIDEIINKEAIVYNFDENYPSLDWLSMMTRESLYNALYYLEKWEEEKAISYLIENYKLSKLLISSYWTLVNFIVWITINTITLSDLEFIMNNYELKDSTLNYIKNNFESSIDINSSFEISMNYEYNYILSELLIKTPETVNINWTLIFFSESYLKEWLKNVYYWISQMYNDMELDLDWYYNTEKLNTDSFDSSDDYICSKKNIDKLRWDWIPKLFFRKNTVSNILLVINCISNHSYKPDLENIILKEKNILDKINKIWEK